MSKVTGTSTGANNGANGQVTTTGSSAQLVAARPTRRYIVIRNNDATNSAFVGFGVVSSANGFQIKPTDPPLVLYTTAQINCIQGAGAVVLSFVEIYD